MIHRLCISLVLFVVDTTTLGSRIVYLSLLIAAPCPFCSLSSNSLLWNEAAATSSASLATRAFVFDFLVGEWWWMDGGEDGRIARAPVNHPLTMKLLRSPSRCGLIVLELKSQRLPMPQTSLIVSVYYCSN